jgi:anti-sigma regulatory factor (Ser/Thr protein kinase)
MDVEAKFEPDPSQVRAARRFVRERVPAALQEDAALVISELVSNAIEHAMTPVAVRIRNENLRVRVEVSDSSSILPAVADLVDDSDRGRGLRIVEELTDAWGVESRDEGKIIWFEMTYEH